MSYELYLGDWLELAKTLPSESVQTIITSPPYYGLRDYGKTGQLGLEETYQEYVQKLATGFSELKRVLKDDGTLWLNLGDSYANSGGVITYGSEKQKSNIGSHGFLRQKSVGFKPKDLMGMPWRVAFALQDDGWYLRQDIIWHKTNPMPESVTDRCTKSHEYLFLLSKSQRYYFDNEAIKETTTTFNSNIRDRDSTRLNNVPGRSRMSGLTKNNYELRNKRSVWSVATQPFKEAHFATFPPELIRPCVLAASRQGDTILDPFNGSGTTGLVALQHGRKYIGFDLNEKYIDIATKRLGAVMAQPRLEFA